MKISTITPEEFAAGKHVTLPPKRKRTPPKAREYFGPVIGTITPEDFAKGGVFVASAGSRRRGETGKAWRKYLNQVVKPMPEAVLLVRRLLDEEEEDAEAWIGVDLDGTLARYTGFKGKTKIGSPIPRMVRRIRRWVSHGKKVKIFTARAGDEGAENVIKAWLKDHELPDLEITNVKDHHCIQFWDDRAVGVEKNTGKIKEAAERAYRDDRLLAGISVGTEHIRCTLGQTIRRYILKIDHVTPADDKVLLSEIGDIASNVYKSIERDYARGKAPALLKVTVAQDTYAFVRDGLLDEWRDMGLAGQPSLLSNTFFIALKRLRPSVPPRDQWITKGPRWKNVHSAAGHKHFQR